MELKSFSLILALQSFSTPYDLNLMCKLFLSLLIGFLTLLCIKDSFTRESFSTPESNLVTHLTSGLTLLRKEKVIVVVLISLFATGFFFFSIETFWQPQFISILPDRQNLWVLSILSFPYFASALIGSLIAEKLLFFGRIKAIYLFPIGRMLMALFLISLGHQFQIQSFVILFSMIYFFLGLSNIPENLLINDVTPDRYRASILSLSSLVLQLGIFVASVVSALIIKHTAVFTLWTVASVLLALSSLFFLFSTVNFHKNANMLTSK
jgi:predicted MFS family arabinose efflux permease